MYISKPLIFVVISLLVVVLIYSSILTFIVFAAKKDPGYHCEVPSIGQKECCWREIPRGQIWPPERYCQTCGETYNDDTGEYETVCTDKELQMMVAEDPTPPTPPQTPRGTLPLGEIAPEAEQPPTPPQPTPRTPGQSVLPGEGVLEQPPTPPQPTPRTPGQSVLPQDGGVLEQQEQPACPEGQVLDEESGLCVVEEEEPEVQQQEPQEEPEQTESEPEENGSEENGNDENN